MKIRKLFMIACMIVAFTQGARADQDTSLLQIQSMMQDRLQAIAKTYDPESVVIVQMKKKASDVPLPGTALTFKDLTLGEARAKIEIYSKKTTFSNSVLEMMKMMSKSFGVQADLHVSAFPPESGTSDAAPSLLTSPDQSEKSSGLSQILTIVTRFGWAFLVAFAMFLVNLFIGQKNLIRAFGKLEAELRNTGSQAREVSSPKQEATPAQPSRSAAAHAPREQDLTLGALSGEAFEALVTDCYWSAQDRYAAYVWTHSPVQKRAEVMKRLPQLREYFEYVSTLEPDNVGAAEEPYYLSPLPISHIDNEQLLKVVQSNPGLLNRLPQIRQRSFVMKAGQRLDLQRKSKTEKSFDPQGLGFAKYSASVPRILPSTASLMRIQIENIEEEIELIARPDLTEADRRSIPTLAWLSELPNGEISEVLGEFTAKQLASAWVGPPEVLAKLESALPAKKKVLVLEYLASQRATRSTPVFVKLHAESLLIREKLATAATADVARIDSVAVQKIGVKKNAA
jgi:hypothetical protein